MDPRGKLKVEALTSSQDKSTKDRSRIALEAIGLSCSIEGDNEIGVLGKGSRSLNDTEEAPLAPTKKYLFCGLDIGLREGEVSLVTGPSGVGKSTLLRILAGLTPSKDGTICLGGIRRSSALYSDMTVWRQDVRYVPQSKVDIPGTPRDFLRRILDFGVWQQDPTSLMNATGQKIPTKREVKSSTSELLLYWGMSPTCIDSEWATLSGGEAQRVVLALALATRPRVLLLDESTSALDVETKIRVEQSIFDYCKKYGICALWITHDTEQMERLRDRFQPD